MKKLGITVALVGLALASLTGCGGGIGGIYGGTTPSASGSSPSASAPAAGITSLMTTETGLGTIVVDDTGMTVYAYDQDTQNADTSACTGACATTWPAVTISANKLPSLDGVTGQIQTFMTADGSAQVTLNGWPLYHFSGDAAPGDTNGQGLQGIWWVLAPDGTKITTAGTLGY